MVESTCLESMRPSNGTVGSNPTLSAIIAVLSDEYCVLRLREQDKPVFRLLSTQFSAL